MRKFLPLAGIGCVIVLVLAFIIGGAIMIGYGVSGYIKKKDQQKSNIIEKRQSLLLERMKDEG